jgi:hypothetical protein
MTQSLALYTGDAAAQIPADLNKRLEDLAKEIRSLSPTATPPDVKERIATAEMAIQRLNTLIENNKPLDALCPPGAIRRKGFQLMGPEGIKEFDQDERLIMAMYTSAKPLTETLQEYSSRVLSPSVNPAEQLLPLVRENLRIVEARNAADRAKFDVPLEEVPQGTAAVFDAVLAAFEGR